VVVFGSFTWLNDDFSGICAAASATKFICEQAWPQSEEPELYERSKSLPLHTYFRDYDSIIGRGKLES
jgi:hypothetical protein